MRTTALLFCFNQERFVRDAVRDLLAQDLEGLEILLSDDCSTDNSYAIIEEEAQRYKGPHKVLVNRMPYNLGLNRHINFLLGKASGDVLIPFAGDDRFKPCRARRLMERIEADGSLLAHSRAEFIDESCNPVPPMHTDATLYVTDDLRTIARSKGLFIGATAAWRREIFSKYGPLPEEEAYEDLILGFRGALESRISFIPEPLVQYRVGSGVSFQSLQLGDVDFTTQRKKNLVRWRNVILARLRDGAKFGLSGSDPIMLDLRSELFDVEARLAFYGDLSNLSFATLKRPRRFFRLISREKKDHHRKHLL